MVAGVGAAGGILGGFSSGAATATKGLAVVAITPEPVDAPPSVRAEDVEAPAPKEKSLLDAAEEDAAAAGADVDAAGVAPNEKPDAVAADDAGAEAGADVAASPRDRLGRVLALLAPRENPLAVLAAEAGFTSVAALVSFPNEKEAGAAAAALDAAPKLNPCAPPGADDAAGANVAVLEGAGAAAEANEPPKRFTPDAGAVDAPNPEGALLAGAVEPNDATSFGVDEAVKEKDEAVDAGGEDDGALNENAPEEAGAGVDAKALSEKPEVAAGFAGVVAGGDAPKPKPEADPAGVAVPFCDAGGDPKRDAPVEFEPNKPPAELAAPNAEPEEAGVAPNPPNDGAGVEPNPPNDGAVAAALCAPPKRDGAVPAPPNSAGCDACDDCVWEPNAGVDDEPKLKPDPDIRSRASGGLLACLKVSSDLGGVSTATSSLSADRQPKSARCVSRRAIVSTQRRRVLTTNLHNTAPIDFLPAQFQKTLLRST